MSGTPDTTESDEAPPSTPVFARHFLLQEAVATGQRFVVWRGTDRRNNEPVALKFFPKSLINTSADMLEVREILTPIRNLRHPRVIAAHQVAGDPEYSAIVTPWVNGPTLTQLRRARPQQCFEVAEIEAWVRTLIDVLDAVHAHGLAHGALRPDCVFVREGTGLCVVGFGTDAWLHFTSDKIFGPPKHDPCAPYRSPAARRGEPCAADDVFAFGALVYELLAGSPPRGPGYWRKHRPPLPIVRQRQANGHTGGAIPAIWESVVHACLEPEEAARLTDFRSIRARLGLEDASAGSVLPTPPPAAPVSSIAAPATPLVIEAQPVPVPSVVEPPGELKLPEAPSPTPAQRPPSTTEETPPAGKPVSEAPVAAGPIPFTPAVATTQLDDASPIVPVTEAASATRMPPEPAPTTIPPAVVAPPVEQPAIAAPVSEVLPAAASAEMTQPPTIEPQPESAPAIASPPIVMPEVSAAAIVPPADAPSAITPPVDLRAVASPTPEELTPHERVEKLEPAIVAAPVPATIEPVPTAEPFDDGDTPPRVIATQAPLSPEPAKRAIAAQSETSTLLPPRPPRRYVPPPSDEPTAGSTHAPALKSNPGRWGTRALSALLVCTILTTMAVGGLWAWRMYESRQEFITLRREVLVFPPDASEVERAKFEERLVAARPRMNAQQWQILRDTWAARKLSHAGPEADARPPAPASGR